MPWEVEQKFAVPDHESLRALLAARNASGTGTLVQVDEYFAHPARDFSSTDEALRIRTVEDGSCVTYKGPKQDRETKTRRELEFPLASGTAETCRDVLLALGFRAVRTVRKHRETFELAWQGRDVELALDAVEGLGTFVELETLADDETLEVARQTILSLARSLGLEQCERRSYLELLLAQSSQSSG